MAASDYPVWGRVVGTGTALWCGMEPYMDSSIEIAVKQLAREMDSWRSIELGFRVKFMNHGGDADPRLFAAADFEGHYIETSVGKRVYEQRVVPADGEPSLVVYYTDGRRGADLLRRATSGREGTQVTIKPSFANEANSGWTYRPEPLKYFFVGKVPLPRALREAVPLGESRRLGRACDVYLVSSVKGSPTPVVVYHLDRVTSIPLEVLAFADERGRSEDRPLFVWSAESLDDVEGHHLSLNSVLTRSTATTPPKVLYQWKIVVDSVRFDRDYQESLFWPKIGPETKVIDTISKKVVFTPTKEATRHSEDQSSSVAPIQAISPGDWTGALSWVSLGLGISVLFTGFLLWLRRGANGNSGDVPNRRAAEAAGGSD